MLAALSRFVFLKKRPLSVSRLPHLKPPKNLFMFAFFGGITSLGFAPLYAFPLYVLGWAQLYLGLRATKSTTWALKCIFVFVYAHLFFGLYWVVFALGVDWQKYSIISPLVLLGLPLVFVFWYVLCLGIWHKSTQNIAQPGKLFGFAIAWFSSEMIKSFVFTGFPWNLPANIWTFSPLVMKICSWCGAYGLSYGTICIVLVCVLLCQKEHVLRGGRFLSLMALLGLLSLWDPFLKTQFRSLRLHIVQPNLAQVVKMDPQYAHHILQTLQLLSHPPVDDGHLIIWPEGALPFGFDVQNLPDGMEGFLHSMTRDRNSLLITGTRYSDTEGKRAVYNSCVLINPQGKVVSVYDKVHLLPFGEFMPFRNFLPKLLADLAVGPIDMQMGKESSFIELKSGYKFKPLICFESLFPDLVDKAIFDAFIVMTNDAWFGYSVGPFQHLSSSQLRAAEFGVPVIRSAYTGISGIIDGHGRLIHQIPLEKEGTISALLPTRLSQTFYAKNRWMGTIILILISFMSLQIMQGVCRRRHTLS